MMPSMVLVDQVFQNHNKLCQLKHKDNHHLNQLMFHNHKNMKKVIQYCHKKVLQRED